MEQMRYQFTVPHYVSAYGEELKVVGSLPELGGWDAAQAPQMTWREGHLWRLDIVLPKQPFEFKVTMVSGETVRWEEGDNRVIEAGCDPSTSKPSSYPGAPQPVVIQVHCNFDRTETTPLALMVPKDLVQDAFEVARSALHVLVHRSRQLQAQLADPADAGPSARAAELASMHAAIAGHSSSVASLSGLMERAVRDEDRNEEHVALPVGQHVAHLPRGASLQLLTEFAAASFRSSGAEAGGSPRRHHAGVLGRSGRDHSQIHGQHSAPLHSLSSSHASSSCCADGCCSDGPRSTAAGVAASNELARVVARLGAFLAHHPAPGTGALSLDSDGSLDAALRSEVAQLVALMSEADTAWAGVAAVAGEGVCDAAECTYGTCAGCGPCAGATARLLSAVAPLEAFSQCFATGSDFQDELSRAAAMHAHARDQLQRCIAVSNGLASASDVMALQRGCPLLLGGDSRGMGGRCCSSSSGRGLMGMAAPRPPPSLASCIASVAIERGEASGRVLPGGGPPHNDFTVSARPQLSSAAAAAAVERSRIRAQHWQRSRGTDGAVAPGGGPRSATPSPLQPAGALLLPPLPPRVAGSDTAASAAAAAPAAASLSPRGSGSARVGGAGASSSSSSPMRGEAALDAAALLMAEMLHHSPSPSVLASRPRRHSTSSATSGVGAAAARPAAAVSAAAVSHHSHYAGSACSGAGGGGGDPGEGAATLLVGGAGVSALDIWSSSALAAAAQCGCSQQCPGASAFARPSLPSILSTSAFSAVGLSCTSAGDTASQVVSIDEDGAFASQPPEGLALANLREYWEQQRSPVYGRASVGGGGCSVGVGECGSAAAQCDREMQRNVFQKLLGFFRAGDHRHSGEAGAERALARHSRSHSSSGASAWPWTA
ncbi:hypothetical protein FOA52_002393 [Chlamydomonas sp. UWO 241]|nr:hypothetical protein FOA52_002393 [Chlamydomonas sp. UWO 241]